MQILMISSFKTVVRLSNGTVRTTRHFPALDYRLVLNFAGMLMAERQAARSGLLKTGCKSSSGEHDDQAPRRSQHEEWEVVGYYDGFNATPVTVLSGTSILQIVTGRANGGLGQFAIELYQEAARQLGFGIETPVVMPEEELRRLFAPVVRSILPEFRESYRRAHPAGTAGGAYSRLLLGTRESDSEPKAVASAPESGSLSTGNAEQGSGNGSGECTELASGSVSTEAGSGNSGSQEASSAAPIPESGEMHESTNSYNRVMAATIRGVIGLVHLRRLGQPDLHVKGLNFAGIAAFASDIRRLVTGQRRGADIIPRTAMRILGRYQSLGLTPQDIIRQSDDELFASFSMLSARDEEALNAAV